VVLGLVGGDDGNLGRSRRGKHQSREETSEHGNPRSRPDATTRGSGRPPFSS
jgi:hypothetical protein